MDELRALTASFGYTGLFLLGLAEFGGLPVVAVPVLVVAGAMSAAGNLALAGVIAVVAAGGLLADLAWLSLARWRGHRIVAAACGLSANPRNCVIEVKGRVARFGAPFILVGKFVPGTGASPRLQQGSRDSSRPSSWPWTLSPCSCGRSSTAVSDGSSRTGSRC